MLFVPGVAIGRVPDRNAELPAKIEKAIVRVDNGSGIVLKVRPDRRGGAWLCVLTADHVGNNARAIGFGNGRVANGDGANEFRVRATFRGPVIRHEGREVRVDLAVLSVYVDNLAQLLTGLGIREFQEIEIGELAPDRDVTLAGYGAYAELDGIRRLYSIINEFGTYRSGTNRATVGRRPVFNRDRTRAFLPLQGDLTLSPPRDQALIATSGDAYVLSGDSGGPTLQKVGDNWLLMGIHSFAELHPDPDTREPDAVVHENGVWTDVYTHQYRRWITNKCMAAVPEPASMMILLSLLPLARKWGRRP